MNYLSRLPFTWLILNQCSPYKRFLIAGFSSLGKKPTNCPRDNLVLECHTQSQLSPLLSLDPGITLKHGFCHSWAVFSWSPQAMSHVTGNGWPKDSLYQPLRHNSLMLFLDIGGFYCPLLCLQPRLRMISWRAVSPAARSFHNVQAKICESGIFRSPGHYEMHSFHIPYITFI